MVLCVLSISIKLLTYFVVLLLSVTSSHIHNQYKKKKTHESVYPISAVVLVLAFLPARKKAFELGFPFVLESLIIAFFEGQVLPKQVPPFKPF